MNEKNMTGDDSPTVATSEQPWRELPDGTAIYRGMHLPKHVLSPGQDGYRTPTIEDFEVRKGAPATPNGTPTHDGIAKSDGHHLHLSSDLAHEIFDKLYWRQRIRHYTWTFFTMSMATGGIANVLYSGKLSLRGP